MKVSIFKSDALMSHSHPSRYILDDLANDSQENFILSRALTITVSLFPYGSIALLGLF